MFNQLENKNTASLLGISLSVKSLIGMTAMIFNLFVLSVFATSIWSMSPMIENQDLDTGILVAVSRYVEPPPKTQPLKLNASTKAETKNEIIRTELQLASDDVRKVPDQIKSAGNGVPPIPPSGIVKLGKMNSNPTSEGFEREENRGNPLGQKTNAVQDEDKESAPEPKPIIKPTVKPTPDPTPKPVVKEVIKIPTQVSKGVVNGLAVNLVKPVYSQAAKAVRASGAVTVQVLIDETGRVISANAVNGHPLLRTTAETAARQSKFSPTFLSNQPVKVSGTIVYNFVGN